MYITLFLAFYRNRKSCTYQLTALATSSIKQTAAFTMTTTASSQKRLRWSCTNIR